MESSAQAIVENEGVPDVIINSAGSGEWMSFSEADLSHYKNTMDSPYLATALTCKVFFDLMQERGRGHFIIINSAAAYFSFPGATGYSPSRWALLGFSKSLQADLFNTHFKVSMLAIVIKPLSMSIFVFLNRLFPGIFRWLLRTTAHKSIS